MIALLLPLLLCTPSSQYWIPAFPWTEAEDNSTETEIRVAEDREDMLTTLDHLEAIGEDAIDTSQQLINQAAEVEDFINQHGFRNYWNMD